MASSSSFLFEYNFGPGEVVIDHLGNGRDPPLDIVMTYTMLIPWEYYFLISFHRQNSPFSIQDLQNKSFMAFSQTFRNGKRSTFALISDEAILGVYAYISEGYVYGLQFLTNLRLSPAFGWRTGDLHFFQRNGKRGAPRALSGMRFKYNLHESADAVPKNLELGWTDTSLPSIKGLVVGSALGLGTRGDAFNTLDAINSPATTRLTKIKLTHGDTITSIECFYSDNTSVRVGAGNQNEKSFELAGDEYIKEVQVYASEVIDSLLFVTNKDRFSEKFGGNGGLLFRWDGHTIQSEDSEASSHMGILGFSGITHEVVRRLGPIWASVPPTRYQLQITSPPPSADLVLTKQKSLEGWSVQATNPGQGDTTIVETFRRTFTSTTRLTFSDESSNAFEIGGEVEGHTGLEIEGLFKIGESLKVSAKDTKTEIHKTDNGQEMTHTEEVETKIEVKVAPLSTIHLTAWVTEAQVHDYPWSGLLTAFYADGSKLETKVVGTWAMVREYNLRMEGKAWDKDGKPIPLNVPEFE